MATSETRRRKGIDLNILMSARRLQRSTMRTLARFAWMAIAIASQGALAQIVPPGITASVSPYGSTVLTYVTPLTPTCWGTGTSKVDRVLGTITIVTDVFGQTCFSTPPAAPYPTAQVDVGTLRAGEYRVVWSLAFSNASGPGIENPVTSRFSVAVDQVATPRPYVVLDEPFAAAGVMGIDGPATVTDGNAILVAGTDGGTLLLRRYLSNGLVDWSFGQSGQTRVLVGGRRVAVLGRGAVHVGVDGDIYIATSALDPCQATVGCSQWNLLHFSKDGALDIRFGNGGWIPLPDSSGSSPIAIHVRMTQAPDRAIVLAQNLHLTDVGYGGVQVLSRIDRIDASGGSRPMGSLPPTCVGVESLASFGDGALLVATSPAAGLGPPGCAFKIKPDGNLDGGFGTAGGVLRWGDVLGSELTSLAAMLLRQDGKFTLAAFRRPDANANPATPGRIARFTATGKLELAFGVPNGSSVADANVSALAEACGGKLVGATVAQESGVSRIGLTRYSSNGALDMTASATQDGIVSTPLSSLKQVENVIVREDGVVLVEALAQEGSAPATRLLFAYRQTDCQHPRNAPIASAVEFYNAFFDHYFVSVDEADKRALDSGQHAGWQRTGHTFGTAVTTASSPNPVCRFYIPPAFGDSHFFSASPDECAQVQVSFPQFVRETANAFRADLPDPVTGACPIASPVPVYRLWNNRADTNHRYSRDRAVRDAMVAKGWIVEGYGPDPVAMCAVEQ